MRILKKSDTYTDILFTVEEVLLQCGYSNREDEMTEAMCEIAVREGAISSLEKSHMLVVGCGGILIMRCLLKGIKHISDSDRNNFLRTAYRYITKYSENSIGYDDTSKRVDTSTHKYCTITANSISEFKDVIEYYPKKKRSSIYKYKGKYVLVCRSINMLDRAIRIGEFTELNLCDDIGLSKLEEHGELIVKDKALEIIRNYY